MTFDYNVELNSGLGLYEARLTIDLPVITVTRFKADEESLKYEMRRAVSEIVEQIVEKSLNL